MKALRLIKDERGITLIEALIALAIMGLVAVAFLSGLTTASKALLIADERTAAGSLARSQMEHVKNQEYRLADSGGEATYLAITDNPEFEDYVLEGYSVNSLNRNDAIVEDILGVPWNLNPSMGTVGSVYDDDGLQFIRIIIKHYDKEVIKLEGVKVNRPH